MDWGEIADAANQSTSGDPPAPAPPVVEDDPWGDSAPAPAAKEPVSNNGGGWGDTPGYNSRPSGNRQSRPSNDNSGWGGSGHDNNAGGGGWGDSSGGGGGGGGGSGSGPKNDQEQADRPAPFKPEELNLDEEAQLQADTVGENFKRYQDQTVTCLPPNTIKPIENFEDVIESKLLLTNLERLKYSGMTPIQKWAMPAIMQGYDLIGCAQTGSGKTAAFLLPILQTIMKLELGPNDPNEDCQNPYCLIISPTRELTRQIYSNAEMLSRDSIVKTCYIYGQVSTPHLKVLLSRGCHILVATLGKLKYFVDQGWIGFKNIKFVVLDEGDRLIDDGFSDEVKSILNHETMPPKEEVQLLFFSATFKKDQQKSAKEFLRQRYVFLTVGRVGAANEDIRQEFMEVSRHQKKTKLKEILREIPESDKAIIFTQTKVCADVLAAFFTSLKLAATSIHGDRHQSQREQAISSFRRGEKRFLISSPVGNRGLDLPKVALVINYDLPENIDEYVHRIGRTGRAGHTGRAISFFDRERDMEILPDLIKIIKEVKQEVPSFMTECEVPQGSNSNDDWTASGGDNPAPAKEVPDSGLDDWGEMADSGPSASKSAAPAASSDATEDWGETATGTTTTGDTADDKTKPDDDTPKPASTEDDPWDSTPAQPASRASSGNGGGANRSFSNSTSGNDYSNRTPGGRNSMPNSNRSTFYNYKDNQNAQSGNDDDWGSAATEATAVTTLGQKRPASPDGGNAPKKQDLGETIVRPKSPDFGDSEW